VPKWEAPDRNFIGHRDCLVRNMARYNFIASQAQGHCLDIGCGRGYGFEYLKRGCSSCTGLDISDVFLSEARAQYPEISFIHHTAEKLPFDDASFDTITAFEVIEHVVDDNAFLREIARVAVPGALVVVSTPNRLIASDAREKPLNRFHVREYVAEEFRSLLEGTFPHVTLYGHFDRSPGDASSKPSVSSFLNRIPARLKYLIPYYLQDILSVMLRPPLRLEHCHFELNSFERAHTLYAVCRAAE